MHLRYISTFFFVYARNYSFIGEWSVALAETKAHKAHLISNNLWKHWGNLVFLPFGGYAISKAISDISVHIFAYFILFLSVFDLYSLLKPRGLVFEQFGSSEIYCISVL